MKSQQKDKKASFGKDAFLILVIFFSGLFLRLLYIHQYQNSPFFTSPVIDALSHYIYALRLVSGDWLARGVVAPRAPVYVIFLAVVFKMVGTGYIAARVVQMIFGAFNCVFIYFLGKKVFGRVTGLIAAFICTVYGVFIYFDAEFLSVGLTVFLNLLLLLLLLIQLFFQCLMLLPKLLLLNLIG